MRQALREFWPYRITVLAFAERDVRVKYKQALLGVGWAIIQPLVFMIVFSLTFGKLANFSLNGGSYKAFTLAALVHWQFLSGGVSFGANALLANGSLIRKVYFPREVPVVGSIVAAGVDYGVGLVLFMVVGPFIGARISWTWLLAPFLGLILATLGLGVALAIASFNAYYRDFRYALPFVMQLWLFGSPIAYPISVVDEKYQLLYVIANPAAGVLEASRQVLAQGALPDFSLLGVSAIASVVILTIGYRIFKSMEPNFGDVI